MCVYSDCPLMCLNTKVIWGFKPNETASSHLCIMLLRFVELCLTRCIDMHLTSEVSLPACFFMSSHLMSYLLLLLVSLLLWPLDTQRSMHGWGQRSKVNVLWHSGLFPLRQSGVLSSNALDDLLDLWNQRINLPEFKSPL